MQEEKHRPVAQSYVIWWQILSLEAMQYVDSYSSSWDNFHSGGCEHLGDRSSCRFPSWETMRVTIARVLTAVAGAFLP